MRGMARWSLVLGWALLLGAGTARATAAAGLTITPSKATALAGEVIVFTFRPAVLSPGDWVTFDFGDHTTASVTHSSYCDLFGGCSEVEHAYAAAGTYQVKGQGKISGADVSGEVTVTINELPTENHLYIATAAHLQGYQGTQWRTDVEVHNTGLDSAEFAIQLLARNEDNSEPTTVTLTLAARRTARYNDILATLFSFTGAAALRIVPISGSIIAASRTYNQTSHGTYGQYVPAVQRALAIHAGSHARLIQLAHDPTLASGYRTNLGLVNASPATITVDVLFYTSTGFLMGAKTYELKPFEFRQIDKVFEQVTSSAVEDGYISLSTTTSGARFFAYASVVDNLTGDPVFLPAQVID
jgi:hypothetical protein